MTADFENTPLWRLEVTVPQEQTDAVGMVFEGVAVAVTSFGDIGIPWRVEAYTDVEPDVTALREGLAIALGVTPADTPKISVEFLTPRDWLAENLSTFQPIQIDRFFIYPSHFDGDLPLASIPFRIDAGTAFGSGTHPTTATCLRALALLARRYDVGKALDLGCGSGILAFAMARLWPADVTALDIDPEAVRVTRQNARDNLLGSRVKSYVSDGLRHAQVRRATPYDLIVANVLARPLIGMAGDISGALAPGGRLVLSGLLEKDAAWVTSHYRSRGLVFCGMLTHEDWATLMLRKPG